MIKSSRLSITEVKNPADLIQHKLDYSKKFKVIKIGTVSGSCEKSAR